MYNKSDEESDYLESLFLKPFCERYCDEATPQKPRRFTQNQQQNTNTRRQPCHIYNPVPEHQEMFIRKMSANDNKYKYSDRLREAKANITPYLTRKNQQQGFARQIRKRINEKHHDLPQSLETTQNSWLIIKEMQANLSKISGNDAAAPRSPQQNGQQRLSAEWKRRSIKNEVEVVKMREDTKNIKTMMSYYKNKRLIKHMSKVGEAINLTNSEIQQSVNLRIENKSANKNEYFTEKVKTEQPTKRKIYIRQKGIRTEHSHPFTEQIKRKLTKTLASNNSSFCSIKLKDYLRSSKIDMCEKQNRPKTEVRVKRSDERSLSKKQESMKGAYNEVCGWQDTSQKLENESVLLSH